MLLVYVLALLYLKLTVLSGLTVKLIWLMDQCQPLQRAESSTLTWELGLPYLICFYQWVSAEVGKLFLKRTRGHNLGDADQMVSISATQFCHCSVEETMDAMQTNERGRAPVTLRTGSRQGWVLGLSIANLFLLNEDKECDDQNCSCHEAPKLQGDVLT